MYTEIEIAYVWLACVNAEVAYYRKVRTACDMQGWVRPARPVVTQEWPEDEWFY